VLPQSKGKKIIHEPGKDDQTDEDVIPLMERRFLG
jgi:hypothetical protein